MSLAFKRILLVTHNVQFAIDTQRALESLGEYEVTTVTDASNALDRLKNQPHHLIILDIENVNIPPPEMIQLVYSIQKEIAIVLAPDLPDAHELAITLDVQGVVDIPSPVRALIPIIEYAVSDVYDNLPETAKAPALDLPQETVYIETLVDELLGDDETPYFTSRQIRAQSRSLFRHDDENTPNGSNTLEVLIESKPEGDTVRYKPPKTTGDDESSLSLFQKLANEEPPMPGFGENGTISDLARSVTHSKLAIQGEDETEAQLLDTDDSFDDEDGSQSAPAILVLQTALDQTTPVEAISLKTLYENIQERLSTDQQNIRPLPSWLREGEKFIREPIFLPDDLPSLDDVRPMEYTSTLTQPSESAVVISNSGDLETEVIDDGMSYGAGEPDDILNIDAFEDSVPIDEIEDVDTIEDADSIDIDDDAQVEDDEIDEPQIDKPAEPIEDILENETPLVAEIAPEFTSPSHQEDPYVTQLAVTLTQLTTELTAEATILTRENNIVAYSGDMPVEDIDDLADIINNDWQANDDNARIRFITLPSSGSDYMLYSKATVGGFTLSMVFAGTKQLRVIRRQGDRLLDALEEVPDGSIDVEEPEEITILEPGVEEDAPVVEDIQPEDEPRTLQSMQEDEPRTLQSMQEEIPDEDDEEPVDVGPKHPFTFIWLVDSFEVQLSEHVAQQLVFWLQVQLNSLHWTTLKLEVHQDFVYLHADVPGDFSPSVLIRNLMERSAKIACSEDENLPKDLWADAYLVLTPGRDMTDREIQRFLNFARGEL